MIFFNFIYILSLVIWIGSIVFFSFFTAPVVFKTLDREQAGKMVGVIFPRYYRIGYVCSLLALISLAMNLSVFTDIRLILLTVMALCTFFAGMIVGPKAGRLKKQMKSQGGADKAPDLETQFDKLHSISVRLNGTVLILGLGILWLTAEGFKF